MKAPKTPKGEPLRDTIAFQNKQIRQLSQRIETVVARLSDVTEQLAASTRLTTDQQNQIIALEGDLETAQAKLASETAFAAGYRKRVYDEKADAAKIATDRERRHTSMRNMDNAPF